MTVRLRLTLLYGLLFLASGAVLLGTTYLLAARGRVVSAEELLDRVWDEAANPFTTTVKTTLGRLRAKLGEPPIITTVREGGYRASG